LLKHRSDSVIADAFTPEDRSGGVFPLKAHNLKLYNVDGIRPKTSYVVSESCIFPGGITVPPLHVDGAVGPD